MFLSKDVQQLIADKLLFEDIRSWSQAYPLSLVNNHNYWKNRLNTVLILKGFRREGDNVTEYHQFQDTPFTVYGQINYVLDIEDDDFVEDEMLFLAARFGSYDLINIVMQWDNNPNNGLQGSIAGNCEEIVKYFIKLGADDWNAGLFQAINDDNLYWAKKMIEYGADDIRVAFIEAAQLGRLEICNYLIEKHEEIGWEYKPNLDLTDMLSISYEFQNKKLYEWVIHHKDYHKIDRSIREQYH